MRLQIYIKIINAPIKLGVKYDICQYLFIEGVLVLTTVRFLVGIKKITEHHVNTLFLLIE